MLIVAIAAAYACATGSGSAPAQLAATGGAAQPTAKAASEWLARLNGYREAAGLSAVRENRAFSDGDLKHARYLVKNQKSLKFGAAMHSEDYGNPWYTKEGLEAGQTSDVIPPGGSPFDDDDAIDGWLSAPFHALPMLDPELKEAGYGRYCENGQCAAALQVGRGESWFRNPAHQASWAHLDPERQQHDNPYVYEMPVAQRPLHNPIKFPPDRAVITRASFDGREWPDPLASCDGYRPPTGPAITLQLGTEVNPEITAHSFSRDGQPLEHCIFNAASYVGRDQSQSEAGRNNLKLMGAIVLIPRAPLDPGETYTVSITAGGTVYAWPFSVASKAPAVYKAAAK